MEEGDDIGNGHGDAAIGALSDGLHPQTELRRNSKRQRPLFYLWI